MCFVPLSFRKYSVRVLFYCAKSINTTYFVHICLLHLNLSLLVWTIDCMGVDIQVSNLCATEQIKYLDTLGWVSLNPLSGCKFTLYMRLHDFS